MLDELRARTVYLHSLLIRPSSPSLKMSIVIALVPLFVVIIRNLGK